MKFGYERGSLYWVKFVGNNRSSIQKGYRPAVIVSSLAGNISSDLVLVCPLTTSLKNLSVNVDVKDIGTGKATQVLCNQITVVSKADLGDRIGCLDTVDMNKVDTGILIALGLTKPVVSKLKATQDALAEAHKDREEIEKLLPEAKNILTQLNNLVKKIQGSNLQIDAKSKRVRRSPEIIKEFLKEWADPGSVKKDVAEAFGFPSYSAAANFYYYNSKKVGK